MHKSLSLLIATICVGLLVGGCGSASADQTLAAGAGKPRPDKIIVNDFAVTPDEVSLDKGVAATVYRDMQGRTQTQDDILVGHAVATKLSEKLVQQLNRDGINAVRAGGGVQPKATSVVLKGQFVSIHEGE